MDPELNAMQAILTALEPLEVEGRRRVVTWVMGRFELGVAPVAKGGPRVQENQGDAAAAGASNSGAPTFNTLGELFAAANPETNGQKALVVGYWLQSREGLPDLDGQRINTELKHLGYGVSNITVAMDELKESKPALAIQLRKSGNTRQARKKYKITEAGLKAVDARLCGGEF
jgi:hypothetical protein